MNSLSLLIYSADIVQNLKMLFLVSSFGIGAVCFGVIFFCVVNADVEYNKHRAEGLRSSRNKAFLWLPLVFVSAFIASVIPSSEAIYLIAGSELGEELINNPVITNEAKEILQDVRAAIKSLSQRS